MSHLEEARREAEERFRELRASLERELGGLSLRRGLWWLLGAGAVGLAVAMGRRARRKRIRTQGGRGAS